MKKKFLWLFSIIAIASTIFLIGCQKERFFDQDEIVQVERDLTDSEIEDVVKMIEDAGISDISRAEIANKLNEPVKQNALRAGGGPCYDSSDLTSFLAQYGQCAPDYIPTWNNYFQDANCAVAKWQYFGHERDPETGEGVLSEMISDSIVWNVSGATVTTFEDDGNSNNNTGNLWFQTYTVDENLDTIPNCGFFQPPTNGGHETTVTVYVGGAVYQRSAAGWAQVNNVPDEFPYSAPNGPGYSEPSSTFDWSGCFCPIEFEPYEFMVEGLQWDLNYDGCVNVADLLILLAGYGAC